MARPTLFEQCKRLRLQKGLTQADVARMLGKSQSYIARLENGDTTLAEERRCLDRLEARRVSRLRTPGGEKKAGRLQRRRGVRPSEFRGEPLMPSFDHNATLPPDASWKIEGVCRSSVDTELAFLFDANADLWGICGYHKIGDTIKRGRIIVIAAEYAAECDLALEAFANGDILWDDNAAEDQPETPASSDDGLLADEG